MTHTSNLEATRTTVQITTSVPPTTNNCYVNAAKGRRLTPVGKAYKKEVEMRANEAGVQKMHFRAPYSLALTVYFPDARKADISNRIKLAEDALMEAIGGDDSDVRILTLEKRISRDNPRAEITLEGSEG